MSDVQPEFRDMYTFKNAFLRLHPEDPYFPSGSSLDDDELTEKAKQIHYKKHQRYLSKGEKVRIPKKDVRITDMEIEDRDLMIVDSGEQMSLYYIMTQL